MLPLWLKPPAAPTDGPPPTGTVIGKKRSKVYHESACPDYAKVSPQNRVAFQSHEEAEHAGYRKARNCP
jgi:methylphosphotriester-DNA--protein-cysteine methyltransferase